MTNLGKITIKEIAEEAGVSQQTVSRVLNNRPDVAVSTRKRVKEIIAKRDYRPSSIARGIAQGRSYILGVVSASLENYGPSTTLMAVEERANQLGYTLILRVIHDPQNFDIDEQLRYFISHHVDGIVWTLPDMGNIRDAILQKIPQLAVPTVFLNMHAHPDLMVVDFNNESGGQIATEHLIEQGYRNIGMITGPMDWMVSRHRYRGWKKAMETAVLPIADRQVVEGDWSCLSGEVGLKQLLKQFPEMDAAFISNDRMALGAMRAARELGIDIPSDLALVGYDDAPEADFFAPPLTTIRQDLRDPSFFAVNMVDKMITEVTQEEKTIEPRTYLFPPQLIVRQSSAVKA
ncbi:MAG: LacI family DNA-binding transcriptional regulator [Anaerolineae bacterium]|nr:LacI family DNA-binding transcriptional regulator [Anaerolineae bacterium]